MLTPLITGSLATASIYPPIALSCIAIIGLVLCDIYQRRGGRYLFKPLAAAAFIWLAIVLDATATPYGSWLLAGLIFCMIGDLLLMPDSDRFFLAGLFAFLCGHLLYAVAFLNIATSLMGLLVSCIPALLLLTVTTRWLAPHVDSKMKIPVMLYIAVITFMLLCAGLSAGQPVGVLIIVGAWGFAFSDLAVARQQFVHPGPKNGLWGTPLYFISQMLLAASLGI